MLNKFQMNRLKKKKKKKKRRYVSREMPTLLGFHWSSNICSNSSTCIRGSTAYTGSDDATSSVKNVIAADSKMAVKIPCNRNAILLEPAICSDTQPSHRKMKIETKINQVRETFFFLFFFSLFFSFYAQSTRTV